MWLVTGVPTVFMYVMSCWALVRMIVLRFTAPDGFADPVAWVAVILVALAGLMLIEAILLFTRGTPPAAPLVASGTAARASA